MTLQELSRYYKLRLQLDEDKEVLRSLREKASGSSSPSLSGMPPGSGDGQAIPRAVERILEVQPASCAYGLNLQAGGHHLVWYSLPWSLELYEQGEARLYRQGQTQPVIVHRLLVKGGADQLVARALAQKDAGQSALLEAVKAKIREEKEGV